MPSTPINSSHADPRPLLTPALERVVAEVVTRVPGFAGLESDEILVVGLAAHGHAAASVRPLADDVARSVHVEGKRRRIELGLRPPFFLEGDAPRRLATLVHELLHLDPSSRGRLLESRRHRVRSHAEHEREARALTKQYLHDVDPLTVLCLAHHGEVLLRHWRHRPVAETAKKRFADDDIYDAPIVMVTPAGARGGWW